VAVREAGRADRPVAHPEPIDPLSGRRGHLRVLPNPIAE
jgi:hypothetical protein